MNISKSTDLSLLLLRVTFGGLMLLNHGLPKLEKLTGDAPIKFAEVMGMNATMSLSLAVFAEVLCAALLIVGLFTRFAALPLTVTMLVAVFVIHWADPLTDKESALLYLIPFLILLMKGGGWYSLDRLLGRN